MMYLCELGTKEKVVIDTDGVVNRLLVAQAFKENFNRTVSKDEEFSVRALESDKAGRSIIHENGKITRIEINYEVNDEGLDVSTVRFVNGKESIWFDLHNFQEVLTHFNSIINGIE